VITEQDLQEAIAECEGQRNPNSNTCIKLAAFYIIKDHLFGTDEKPVYSFALPPTQKEDPEYESDTEFAQAIKGLKFNEVMEIMDDLMSTIQIINPRLYDGVMRRIAG